MEVQFIDCGFAWHVFDNLGFIRLQARDGRTWVSDAVDADTLTAVALVLKEGRHLEHSISLSETQLMDLKSALRHGGRVAFPW